MDPEEPEGSGDSLEKLVQRRTAQLEAVIGNLRQIKERFEAVYDHHYQLTGLLDKEGRLLMGNRTAMDFAGIQAEDVIGRRFVDTPWWTHSEEVRAQLQDAIERALEGEFVRFETTHISASGDTRIIDFCISPVLDDRGEVVYLVPEGHDITDRKSAERSLRASEEKYRTLFDSAIDAIFVLDGGGIQELNEAALQMFGATEDQLLGTRPWEHSPERQPDGRKSQEWAVEISRAARAGRPQRFEWLHQRPDGSTFIAEVSLTSVELPRGRSLFAVVRDISEQKRAEEQRERLEAQLRQAQKMEAVGQLAGGVAHDFNNLLQVILGYGELAIEGLDRRSSVRESFDAMMKAANQATALVGQLLAFSRRLVLELEVVDLNEVVENLARMIRRIIGEHISFSIVSKPGPTMIQADRGQIEQVLMNLCVNARDAMPAGGTLTIQTEITELTRDFGEEDDRLAAGTYALLSVRDTGEGMDEETRRHIFEPFFSTKGEGEGTGLGLSTVYGIVRQHRGTIQVRSERGKGSEFRIYLPLSDSAMEADAVAEAAPAPGGTELILLAEDDEANRSLAERVLTTAGYTVLTAADGDEAVRLFDESTDRIDLAVLDVVMPRSGGRAVYEHIRSAGSQMPVVFVSGYSPEAPPSEFLLEEGPEVLQKPYRRDELLLAVRQALDS